MTARPTDGLPGIPGSPTFGVMAEPSTQNTTTRVPPNVRSTYAAPGLHEMRDSSLGRRVVTTRRIAPGETIAIWRGQRISGDDVAQMAPEDRHQLLQVGLDDFLYVDRDDLCVVDFINHSCEPNCGFTTATTLVAMQEIPAGETITFDYAMSDANSFIEFSCRCGTSTCRGRMTGEDWRIPQLQRRYAGWFAPHVDALIRAHHDS
ncbi:MAG: SET domain-containing protein [Ilumatobacteraceae bacterium]